MKNRLYLCFVLAGLVLSIQGQEFEYQQFTKDGETLNFRILYPEDFDPSQKYPIVLFLHGAGERGDDNEKQLVHGSKLFLSNDYRANYPSVVIFPQCPKEDYWSNAKVDRKSMPIGLKYKRKGKPTQALTLAMQLMDSIASLNYAKNDQIYLGGLSMGGMGTFELLSRKPNMFAAAVAICGGGQPKNVEDYAGTPMWVFHGSQDNVVLPKYSTKMVLAMQEAGGEVRYTLYPEANHNSWDAAFAEPDLFPWLFGKTRTNN